MAVGVSPLPWGYVWSSGRWWCALSGHFSFCVRPLLPNSNVEEIELHLVLKTISSDIARGYEMILKYHVPPLTSGDGLFDIDSV